MTTIWIWFSGAHYHGIASDRGKLESKGHRDPHAPNRHRVVHLKIKIREMPLLKNSAVSKLAVAEQFPWECADCIAPAETARDIAELLPKLLTVWASFNKNPMNMNAMKCLLEPLELLQQMLQIHHCDLCAHLWLTLHKATLLTFMADGNEDTAFALWGGHHSTNLCCRRSQGSFLKVPTLQKPTQQWIGLTSRRSK